MKYTKHLVSVRLERLEVEETNHRLVTHQFLERYVDFPLPSKSLALKIFQYLTNEAIGRKRS